MNRAQKNPFLENEKWALDSNHSALSWKGWGSIFCLLRKLANINHYVKTIPTMGPGISRHKQQCQKARARPKGE